MVNVAGRSKGCSTCRRRHVKCDETHPVCQRCEKAGFHCDGPQTTVFIQGKIVKSRRSQKPRSSVADAGTTTVWKREDVEETASLSPEHLVAIPQVRFRLNENEVYICYLRCHLLLNGPIDLGLQELQASDIDMKTPSVAADGAPLFVQAALSFATLFFGSRYQQNRILAQGYAIHGVALKRLNHALGELERRSRDDVIVSVVILAMLELFMPTGPKNWLKHMLGLEQLLALRDPSSLVYASVRTLELYKGVRHMILIASLRNRTPSIFARPEWKSVLRTALSLETREEQDLHDVLADCSVLMAVGDDYPKTQHASGSEFIQRREETQCRVEKLLVFLEAWKLRWDSNEENVYVEECIEAGTAGTPPRIIYRFMNGSAARMLMLYNTALLYVLGIMATLEATQHSPHHSPDDLFVGHEDTSVISESPYYPSIQAAGLDIARCISDYLQHKRARGEMDFASPVVQWAVITAGKALNSEDVKWMVGFLEGDATFEVAKKAWEI
ncbi:hypothetical protein G6011_10624 [Alternaria panax]|uniref:Zn(2)-C6 fungal-type domain-containing protein n=1 Tax=Alternaria panax TaxID=48097 RepID=A0AAD4NS88_9PLEO|nr:hypothetical protein G6011_10624 [Alternaria panax]